MSATQVASPNTDVTTADNGLSFEVREIEYEDDSVPTPGPRGYGFNSSLQENNDSSPSSSSSSSSSSSPMSEPGTPMMLNPLMRSCSSAITSPTAAATAVTSTPSFQCSPAMATADGMFAPPPSFTTDASAPPAPAIRTHPYVKRLEFGDNPETIATLKFLESQGINTTALVTQHITKYGSRARIAVSGDGDVVGFAMFDNEIDREQLRDMATYTHSTELKQYVDAKPFIFLQMLIMNPHFITLTKVGAEWKKELVAQFCDCVTKNGKIAIARTETENQSEIEFYRECGFFTMQDMGIPSYPSSKGIDISVLAYTPLGIEGTTEIFKKFYSMGARF
jgi:hypothetical protein